MFLGDSREDSKRFDLVKCTEHKLHDERQRVFWAHWGPKDPTDTHTCTPDFSPHWL